jgi:prevent-host-death family protein
MAVADAVDPDGWMVTFNDLMGRIASRFGRPAWLVYTMRFVKKIGIREARARLAELIERAGAGEVIALTRRGPGRKEAVLLPVEAVAVWQPPRRAGSRPAAPRTGEEARRAPAGKPPGAGLPPTASPPSCTSPTPGLARGRSRDYELPNLDD